MTTYAEKKATAAAKAEVSLAAAADRLSRALEAYDREVEVHEERGDGFFSSAYLTARREAVLARKHHETRSSALATARAEAEAPTLALDGVDA